MFKKENKPPTKQGVFYQLNLNKNNGPFLSKDIMYSNHKSNNLLTNDGLLSQHKMMAQTLNNLEKTIKTQPTNEAKTENFNSIFEYCQEQLKYSHQVVNDLEQEQAKFKKDMETLYEKIATMNNKLLEGTMPVLRNLMKKVKETNQNDKATFYKTEKELNSIEMEKRAMEHIILSCKNRIERLENIFGVQHEEKEKSSGRSSFISTQTNNFFE